MKRTHAELYRGVNRVNILDAMLKRGKVYELETETFNDRGHRTSEKAKYILAGVYPHHAVFRRKLPIGGELTYSFTKTDLVNMILGEE